MSCLPSFSWFPGFLRVLSWTTQTREKRGNCWPPARGFRIHEGNAHWAVSSDAEQTSETPEPTMFILLITLFVLVTLLFGLAAAALLSDAFKPQPLVESRGNSEAR